MFGHRQAIGDGLVYPIFTQLTLKKNEGSFEEQESLKSKPFVLKVLDDHEKGYLNL
jgi:hypothetical protein